MAKKGNCDIYGCDENTFAEGIASSSLDPSKGAFNASDSAFRTPGKTSSPRHTDHRTTEDAEPTEKRFLDRSGPRESEGN